MKARAPEFTVAVAADGKLTAIYSDDLAELFAQGETKITRASHVEPRGTGWIADMSPMGGPQLGPTALRADALQLEKEWLEARLFG